MPFNVLIIDDSILVRRAVRDILEKNVPGVSICGEARNGREGLEKILHCEPDLVILDVEMPVMDGLSVLRELRERNLGTPVLMLSVLTQNGADTTLQALELGALDFVPKPSPRSGLTLHDIEQILIARVNGIIQARRDRWKESGRKLTEAPLTRRHSDFQYDVLLIGSSTGGPQALQTIFRDLPGDFPVPVLVVQHMPPVFTKAFANRLDGFSPLHIMEAEDGALLQRGSVYLAPGNRHMLVEGRAGQYRIRLSDAPPVHAHRPSIDVTLDSVTEVFGRRSAALIMTGMGWDGAAGMRRLYDTGGLTLAQDEASSVIFGMNRRAIEMGGVIQVVPLKNIVEVLLTYFNY